MSDSRRVGGWVGGEAVGSMLQEHGTSLATFWREGCAASHTGCSHTTALGGTREAGMNGVLSRIDSRAHVMALDDKPCWHSAGQSTPTARESGLKENDVNPQWNLESATEKRSFINAVVLREMRSCFNGGGKKCCRASESKKISANDPPAIECRVSIGRGADATDAAGRGDGRTGPWSRLATGGVGRISRLQDRVKKDPGRGKRG